MCVTCVLVLSCASVMVCDLCCDYLVCVVTVCGLVCCAQEVADQHVSEELLGVAMQNPRFRRTRQKYGGRGGRGAGGGGGERREGRGRGAGGYRVRPGLGASAEVSEGE